MIHNFSFNRAAPHSTQPALEAFTDHRNLMPDGPGQSIETRKTSDIVAEHINVSPERVIEVVTKGLHVLDEGMSNWLGGIKVPTLDSYKLANVYLVSQDRSILTWAQEFFDGRVSLPVISVQRTSWTFDQSRFTYPYHPYMKRFTDNTMREIRVTYRPMPVKVEYTCSVWTNFRQDAEYINMSIFKRSNPMGLFVVEDDFLQHNVHVFNTGNTNSSEIDIGSKDRPKILYEIPLMVEYQIPINEKIFKTILGKVVSIKELDTNEVFDVYRVTDY